MTKGSEVRAKTKELKARLEKIKDDLNDILCEFSNLEPKTPAAIKSFLDVDVYNFT